jgi:hypothetical protein
VLDGKNGVNASRTHRQEVKRESHRKKEKACNIMFCGNVWKRDLFERDVVIGWIVVANCQEREREKR